MANVLTFITVPGYGLYFYCMKNLANHMLPDCNLSTMRWCAFALLMFTVTIDLNAHWMDQDKVDWIAERRATHVRGRKPRFRIRVYSLEQSLTWKFYIIITYDPSSYANWDLAFFGNVADPCTNDSTSARRRRRRNSTYWHVVECEGVGWLRWWFILMAKFVIYTRERNVTMRSEIWNKDIHPIGF